MATSVGDAVCFTLLGSRPGRYGAQRVWGSLGWGLLTLTTGWLVDMYSEATPGHKAGCSTTRTSGLGMSSSCLKVR